MDPRKSKKKIEAKHLTVSRWMKIPAFLLRWILLGLLVVIPLLLVLWSGTWWQSMRYARALENSWQNLESIADRIGNCPDEKVLWAHFLNKLLFQADHSSKPEEKLIRLIRRLNAKFPGLIRTMAWNKSGILVPEISDFSGKRFIWQKVYRCLKAVKEWVDLDSNDPLDEFKAFKEHFGFAQHVLGHLCFPRSFLQAYDLERPEIVYVDIDVRRQFFWHSCARNLTLLVFLHRDAIDKKVLWHHRLKEHRKSSSEFPYVGYSSKSLIGNFLLIKIL